LKPRAASAFDATHGPRWSAREPLRPRANPFTASPCPKCQSLARAEWVEKRTSEVLQAHHFHDSRKIYSDRCEGGVVMTSTSEIVKNQLSVSRQVPGSPSTPLISLVHSVGLGERQRISDHAVVASVGHDGRASTITDAIRAHGCQADAARAAFEALSEADLCCAKIWP